MLFTVCRYVFSSLDIEFFCKVRSQGNKAFSVSHISENLNMKMVCVTKNYSQKEFFTKMFKLTLAKNES